MFCVYSNFTQCFGCEYSCSNEFFVSVAGQATLDHDTIKHFFKADLWNDMSPYEKEAKLNQFKAYILCLQQGEFCFY